MVVATRESPTFARGRSFHRRRKKFEHQVNGRILQGGNGRPAQINSDGLALQNRRCAGIVAGGSITRYAAG
jgi:hypothetical protein